MKQILLNKDENLKIVMAISVKFVNNLWKPTF